ncbi:MAG: tetratricopeptide repeat protein [Desulfobacterales bacterium]|nr:tetratricopeptide repeat protein [Desulfobacterales bacterium]
MHARGRPRARPRPGRTGRREAAVPARWRSKNRKTPISISWRPRRSGGRGRRTRRFCCCAKAMEADPDSAYLQRELATIYLQNKEEDKALEVLDELLAKHPDDVKGLILYGGIQQLRKQNDAATQDATKK